jgi:hypothetical protein
LLSPKTCYNLGSVKGFNQNLKENIYSYYVVIDHVTGSVIMQKKTWETPQLIILARGTPEETLTNGCKVIQKPDMTGGGATSNYQDGCNETNALPCGTCQGRSGILS